MSQNSNLPVKPIPLIFDDDGSQDGMTALAYMLANPKFDVQAITVANGIARPEIFDDNLKRMLGRLGDTDIPVGVGRSTPLSGNNEFPDFIRDGADTFWSPFVTLPEEVPDIETKPAVDLIIETIKNSPEPVAILATGPLTNIAEALRQDPSIIDNISIVQIMGGAVFVPGNLPVLPDPPFSTNETAEFNIWVDPVAAQEVFDAGQKGLKIQLTPLDATNQVEFDRQDYLEWLETGTPESVIAAELLDFALTVIQSDNDPNPVWDLVAAINLSEPDFSPETPLYIDVDTESDPGDTQGQTEAVLGLPANVLVSLDPSFDNIAFDPEEVFSYLELPVVSLSADKTVISEGGDAQLITFNLSEPAPNGGLAIKLQIDDPDGEPGDTDNALELFSNVTDFGNAVEDGVFVANITIAEGATSATIGIKALADNKVEGDETYSLTLLENENYLIDFASTTILTTIEDTTSVANEIVGTPQDDKLISTNAAETIFTGAGDDEIDLAFGGSNNRVDAGSGNDVIYLSSQNRVLGGEGDDKFFVDSNGDNIISGGEGKDEFWIVNAEIPESANTIVDFEMGVDVIGILGSAGLGIDANSLTLNEMNGNTEVAFGGQTLAILNGVTGLDISESVVFA